MKCTVCGEEKDETLFKKHKIVNGIQKYRNPCKVCHNNRNRKYKKKKRADPEFRKKENANKRERRKDPVYHANELKLKRKRNHEKMKDKEYRDKVNEYRRKLRKDPISGPKMRATARAWHKKQYDENQQYRAKVLLRNRFNKMLKTQNVTKSNGMMKLLDCTLEFFMSYIESQFTDGMTWDNAGEWHYDHIKECQEFDLTDPEEQKKCFHWSNFQPLWGTENIVKGQKTRVRLANDIC